MLTNVSEENLLASGYKEFPVASFDRCTKNWAKVIRNGQGGHLYQIVVRMWDFSRYGHGITFDAQLYLTFPGDRFAYVTYHCFETIKEVEDFCAEIFIKSSAIAYCNRYDETASV